ncbi:MAG: hypothetical protein ACREH4_09025 [Vitreimonas sp.]
MIGDAADIFARLKRVMPRWFGQDQAPTPVLDALLQAPSSALATVHAFYLYAKLQTRIATATGGWLDLIAFDFFAGAVVRAEAQSDASFRATILVELFRPKATRASVVAVIEALTGKAPRVFEPTRAADTGGYRAGGCAYGAAGGWGSHRLPAQVFVEIERPRLHGVPNLTGYGHPAGGYDTAAQIAWAEGIDLAAATDAAINRALDRVRPVGVTLWTRIVAKFDEPVAPPEAPGAPAVFPDSWTHRAPIVIQQSVITGASTLTDFPVLLTQACLPDDFLDDELFQGDGGDIRFSSDAAGETPLACEIVSFAGNPTPGNATCEIWVKVPSVSPSANTAFYMWRKSGTGQTQPAVDDAGGGRNAVWSDYLGVWHGDTLIDSTGNGNDLTAFGGATVGASLAKIGKAFSLSRASAQYLSAGSAPMLDNLEELTLQCWARNTSAINYTTLAGKTLPTGDTPWYLWQQAEYSTAWFAPGGEDSGLVATGAQNEWHLFAGGAGGVETDNARMWKDGESLTGFPRGTDPQDDAVGNFLIGYGEGGGGPTTYHDGQIDEVRLHSAFLDSDWMQADYETQANPALFSIPGAVTAL